jgi:hypothetical protein
MKLASVSITLALCLASFATIAQQTKWQQSMEEARRAAARGVANVLILGPRHALGPEWEVGAYVFHNNPRPYCYAYVIPGEWHAGERAFLRSKDGRTLAGVTFRPPSQLERMAGATMLERARNAAVAQLERDFHQPMTDVELLPFESARSGTWLMKAGPVLTRDGRREPFPLYILVDLPPHTVAEVNVLGSEDNEGLARRIIEKIRTTSDPGCYWADLERMYKALFHEQAKIEYLKSDPPKGTLKHGEVVYVDDGTCPGDEVKEITGASDLRSPRRVRCVKPPKPR